jgi:glycosyltransferase involved in cell wall biosynthesis
VTAPPRVSVMIPTYNRARLLEGAIESVLAQSYRDYEIIVVDDGSTEDIQAVAARYGPKVRFARIDRAGIVEARNVGMRMAQGEYLCLLDSDDLYYPHKLALQVDHLDRHPDTVMVYTELTGFDDDGYRDEFHLKTYHRNAYRDPACAYERLFSEHAPLSQNAILRQAAEAAGAPHWLQRSEYRGDLSETYVQHMVVFTNSMMFRRDVLPAIGLQRRYFGHYHDLEFALRLCRAGTVAFIDNPTYRLRYHPGQVSTTRGPNGGRTSIELQRGLLRVARVYACEQAYYQAHRLEADRLVSRLCRAAAVPMLAYGGGSRHLRRYLPRRARPYLALSARHGDRSLDLYALSYLPTLVKRVYFRVWDAWRRRTRR